MRSVVPSKAQNQLSEPLFLQFHGAESSGGAVKTRGQCPLQDLSAYVAEEIWDTLSETEGGTGIYAAGYAESSV